MCFDKILAWWNPMYFMITESDMFRQDFSITKSDVFWQDFGMMKYDVFYDYGIHMFWQDFSITKFGVILHVLAEKNGIVRYFWGKIFFDRE